MPDISLLEELFTITTGMSAANYRDRIGAHRLPVTQYDVAVADDPIPFHEFADIGVTVTFDREQTQVASIEFGPAFTGSIHGISIGMNGNEIESRLGPCDRTWPMPHPNYVLIYDYPEFLRIDLSRRDERVIAIYR